MLIIQEINVENRNDNDDQNTDVIRSSNNSENKDINIKVINNQTRFTTKYKLNQILKINIAHNEGNYFTNPTHLNELKNENLIAFKYCDEKGDINKDSNPNGAMENIAGIFNDKKNILGMMPHPERMIDKTISNSDGINLFSSLIS